MTIPIEFRDIERKIDKVIKSGEEYNETVDFDVDDSHLPSIDEEQAREWMDREQGNSDSGDHYFIQPTEPFDIREYSGNTNEILSDQVFIGIDGSREDVKKEELVFLVSRGVGFFYPFTDEISRGKIDHPSRAFFITRPGILKEDYEDHIEIEAEGPESIDYEAVKQKRILFVRHDKSSGSSNPYNQAFGAGVKMMQLSEIAAAERAVEKAKENGVDEENIYLLLDGNLMPTSMESEDYKEVFKRLVLETDIRIFSVVKRISNNTLFVRLLQEKQDLAEEWFGFEEEDIDRDYLTDPPLLRKLLNPGEYTSFFRYRIKGKTEGGEIDIPDELVPAASYVMTEHNEIYRVEFPAAYLNECDEEVIEAFLALSKHNNGGLPAVNEFADKMAKFTSKERKAIENLLENLAQKTLGKLELHDIYGG